MRILIVEDDAKIGRFVERGLKEEGHTVDWMTDGASGLEAAQFGQHDVAIIDVMLPELDGLSLVEQLRGEGRDLPVLILSAKAEVADRVRGLEMGADDYLVKPFSFSELKARLTALMRRSGDAPKNELELQFHELKLDLRSRVATRGGEQAELPPREFSLLEYLMRSPGQVLTKTMILEHVWGYAFDPGTNVVDVLVSRLRKKVEAEHEPKYIRTVRGVGYVLRAD